MIIVNSGLKQKEIIELVEAIKIEGQQAFKFKNKMGIKLLFDELVASQTPELIVKNEIKKASFGRALNFNVEVKR